MGSRHVSVVPVVLDLVACPTTAALTWFVDLGRAGGGVGLHLGAKLTSEGQLAVSCSRSRTLASPRGLGFLTALWRL